MTRDGIVDSHVHVWDPARIRYPWLGDDVEPHLPRDVDLADGRTARLVVVEAAAAPDQAGDELAWMLSLAGRWPQLAGIVAAVDLRRLADEPSLLDPLVAEPRVVGVRHLLQDEPTDAFDDPAIVDGLRVVATSRLAFDACVVSTQLPALSRLLDRADGLRAVLDHLGKPPASDGPHSAGGRTWRANLADLADRPTVHVKLSGLAPEATVREDHLRGAGAFVAVGVELFGAERAMLGSDGPVSVGAPRGTASEWFELVLQAVGRDDAIWRAISGATAERFYRLPPI